MEGTEDDHIVYGSRLGSKLNKAPNIPFWVPCVPLLFLPSLPYYTSMRAKTLLHVMDSTGFTEPTSHDASQTPYPFSPIFFQDHFLNEATFVDFWRARGVAFNFLTREQVQGELPQMGERERHAEGNTRKFVL